MSETPRISQRAVIMISLDDVADTALAEYKTAIRKIVRDAPGMRIDVRTTETSSESAAPMRPPMV